MSTAFNVWTPEGVIFTGTGFGNQTVLYDINPIILTGNVNVFKMWYGDHFTGAINYAESLTGLPGSWTNYGSNPIGVTGSDPVVWKVGTTYYLFAASGTSTTSIVEYTSTDGINWTIQGTAVSVGSAGQWDANVVAQLGLVGIVGGTWYAYYSGAETGGLLQGGLVTSPNGLPPWTKSASNPLIAALNGAAAGGFTFMEVGGAYYCWGQADYNNTQFKANGFTSFFRWSAPTPSGPWTMLAVDGSQVATYYAAVAADFVSLAGNNQLGDPSFVVANGNIYLFYDIGVSGQQGTISVAVATGITPTQLVAGYEGVIGAPISGAPQLNLVTLASDSGAGANANPIGGSWTPISTTTPYNAAQRLSNNIQSTTAATNNDSYWNALTWPNDQWSQITAAATSSTADIGPELRMNTSGIVTCYRMQWGGVNLGSSGSALIRKGSAGTFSTLTTMTGLTVSLGDSLLGVNNGSELLLYYNGICIGPASDISVTSGAAGFEMFGDAVSGNAQISAWSGGSFQAALNGISGSLGVSGAGATVSWTGPTSGSVTADGSGNYSTGEVLLPFGTYTITPTFAGVTFIPTSQIVILSGADMSGVNFTSSSRSSAFSVTDSRISPFGPNNATLVNGTETYTQTPNCSLRWWFDTSFNHTQCTPEDCRAAGAPVASGTYPQNSRVKGG
jgi:hypothetical protein